MATAKPAQSPPAAPATGAPKARSWRRRGLVIGLVAAALLVWFWQPLNSYAQTGAAYGARVACSCRFVGGRALGDCRKDFEPGMELIVLSENRQARTVTARFPLLARQTAAYYPGEGCRLEPWRE